MSTVLYEVNGALARITLNRPDKLNSFTVELHRDLQAALKQAEEDSAVRCVGITGAGRGFCAGQDLAEALELGPLREAIRQVIRDHYNPLIARIRNMPKPVIAAVNGVAAGAGASLALACDLIIMSEAASLVMAFVKIGLVPDSGASYFLPRLIGYHKAMELALMGDKLSARQAHELGLCNQVVTAEGFESAVAEMASRLAAGPYAMGLIKRQMQAGLQQSLNETLDVEMEHQEAAASSSDAQEGIQAFLERRSPQFSGRP